MEIAGLVLAAGAGRRFGQPKALAGWRGDLLVRRAARTLAEAGCAPVVVVIGAQAEQVRAAAPELDFVDNPEWTTGMASSLRAGLAALRDSPAEAAVVLLVDMPGVTPQAVGRITADATPAVLATGGYDDSRRGHPVLLGRDHWAGVAETAVGDEGARRYLAAHDVVEIDCTGLADPTDLDVPPA